MYYRPLIALSDHWALKAALSALASLLTHDVQLVVLIALLVCIDLLTGIWKALQEGTFTANGLRQTAGKVAVYAVLLVSVGALSNAFEMLAWAITITYGYVAVTEVTSIVENIARDDGVVAAIWDDVKGRIHESLQTK